MSNSSRDRKSDELSCKVYVGGLGNGADSREIESVFGQFGRVQSVWVARHPPGFAFVAFDDHRDASDAVRCLDGTKLNGKRVRVEKSSGESRWEKWNLPPPDSSELKGVTLDYKDIREAILLRNQLQVTGSLLERRNSRRSASRGLRSSSRNRRSRSSRSSRSSGLESCSSDPANPRHHHHHHHHRARRREKFRRERRRSSDGDRPERTEDDDDGRRRKTRTRTGSGRRRSRRRHRRSRRSYDETTSSSRSSSDRISSPHRNQSWKGSTRSRTAVRKPDADVRETASSLPSVVQIGDLNGNLKFPGAPEEEQKQSSALKENVVCSSKFRRETTRHPMTSDACSQTDPVSRRTLGIQCCRSADLRRPAAKSKIKIANATAAPATSVDQPPPSQVDAKVAQTINHE